MGLIRLRAAALASIAVLFLLSGCGSNSQPFNDTPIITSIFPSSAVAGGPGITLNVAGTGFISTSVVYWNNSARTTTFNATSTQLSIAVTAQDLAVPGTAQVIVVSPIPGGGPSTAVNFTITPAQNPVPTITSLSPSGTPVGVLPSGNILTVNGTNFISSSSVNFNGILRASTFVSATQLTVPMSASDVASNATINVTVSNPVPGGGVSGSAAFKVGTGGSVRLKASVAAGEQLPQVVSVSAAGGPANGASAAPAVSSDGRFVAFYSTATNLVAEGSSGNIFVRDTCAGALNCLPQTAAVDLAPDGGAPNAAAESHVAISGDGRFVAFASSATNLVTPGLAPAPAQSNVYVRDLCAGAGAPAGCVPHTEIVSIGPDGDFALGASNSPSLSSDGRFVAFVSEATGLVPGGAARGSGVYVRDTCAGAAGMAACVPHTYLVSSSINNGSSAQTLDTPAISADGRYVAFDASNSAAALDTHQPASQVFLADTCLGSNSPASCVPSTSEISVSADGSPLQGLNRAPSMSADARFVVFESTGPDSVPTVFLRDTCLGVAAGCAPLTALLMQNAAAPSLSSNGRYVSVVSNPSVAPSGAASVGALYLYDTCFTAVGACNPQAYAIGAAGLGAASLPLAVSVSPAPLASDGSSLAIPTSAIIAGLPMSGYGDVLLLATPF